MTSKGLGKSLGPFATADEIHDAIIDVMENTRCLSLDSKDKNLPKILSSMLPFIVVLAMSSA